MCRKAIVFAGTTEGRKIAEYLSQAGISTIACTATGYGGELLRENEHLSVFSQRMDEQKMQALFHKESPSVVVDATHPYAKEVTKNIQGACETLTCKYLRINREIETLPEDEEAEEIKNGVVHVDSVKEAAEYLSHTTGNVLISTGSKELSAFAKVESYQERFYARVLSLPQVVAECAALGFSPSHLFAMQGPFSVEMNFAMLTQVDACYFVTKESGSTGGFLEKYEAAKQFGAILIVIGRPPQSAGVCFTEGRKILQELFGISSAKKITLVGIGMGAVSGMTTEAKEAVLKAELLIGAARMLEAAKAVMGKRKVPEFAAYNPAVICSYIKEHPEYEKITIVLSGDVGFYSGAKKLMEALSCDVKLIPGISSLPYFAARLKTSWEDVTCASLHGKTDNVIGLVMSHKKVFVLLSGKGDAALLCRKLKGYGLGQVIVSIGEDLSYETEHIESRNAEQWQEIITKPLSVCLIEHKKAEDNIITGGIKDDAFIRDKVPMTKEEVRCIILSKLWLKKKFVLFDIGAGTGSVSIEAARLAAEGIVYAIEKNPLGIDLIEKNCRKFAVDNVVSIPGSAPAALKNLPVPTHAFIGGSAGNLREIMTLLLKKCPSIRIVISAVSLETVSEAFLLCREIGARDLDIVEISVAKAKELGSYHMRMGQNPVTLFSFTGGAL